MIKSFKNTTGAVLGAFVAVASIGSGVYDHYTTANPNNDRMLPRVVGFTAENIIDSSVVIAQTIGEKGSELISGDLEAERYDVPASDVLSRQNTYNTTSQYQGNGQPYYNRYDY